MNKLDDEFFARVGHDLRGELATMLAGIHYLLRYEKRLEASHRDMLERVRGAGERLRRLLDELDHAVWLRPDPRRPLVMGPYDPVVLVQELVGSLDAPAEARGVRLLVESELREGEVALAGDVELLRVALEYVAGLAILRSRGRAVRVRLARGAAGAPAILIADEGGPVEADLLARMLEPFVERAAIPADVAAPAPSGQGGASPAPGPRRRERLGLGLAIASGILAAHGGSLAVEFFSPEGQAGVAPVGLRFTCALGAGVEVGGQDHV